MPLLDVQVVSKSFNHAGVLHEIGFIVEERDILCLLGPSGCGKTTLLRIIAGLEIPDSGKVLLEGRDIRDVPVHRRNFGLMFQDQALFPHKNVFENIAFGLRMQRLPKEEIRERVAEVLDLVGMVGFEKRDVNQLSGGEQQRVALARSLAPWPRLLMLDEPLGSLDRTLRERLMNELRTILKGAGVTAIYVTHDQQEAFAVADRVVIMDQGRKVQEGRPEEVYQRPATEFVARFLGLENLLPGRVVEAGPPLAVETALGLLTATDSLALPVGQVVTVLIRPEGARCLRAGTSAENSIVGQVQARSFRGGHYQITVAAGGKSLRFELDVPGSGGGLNGPVPEKGEQVTLCPYRIQVLPTS
jgi:ABC-type Fe3+/spermidine/putrescine transport system ATPase subunit